GEHSRRDHPPHRVGSFGVLPHHHFVQFSAEPRPLAGRYPSVDDEPLAAGQQIIPEEGKNEKHDGELLRDDFVEPLPDDGVLDITDVVYQAVTLATPTFCSCGDQCPGPPERATGGASGGKAKAKSGAGGSKTDDRPIDPRWKNLKTLFPNEDSKENS
ncbi:MAG: DUF177 domain-containing protein, partial [Candidatus Melainabacteria bacterium]|nr:DUF177 domain-containing protein [Candidatus Melainabacteria bacterium]